MKIVHLRTRAVYAAIFLAVLLAEVLIALFVRDAFVRPYGGDILVTVLICCFVRIFFPTGAKLLALWVFLFAAAVEVGQYFDFVALLGLEHSGVLGIMLGSTFSFADILCYAAGCALFGITERLCEKKLSSDTFR